MIDFDVFWDDEYGNSTISKVYYIDATGDRFLVTTANGRFKWVSTDDCEIVEEDDD